MVPSTQHLLLVEHKHQEVLDMAIQASQADLDSEEARAVEKDGMAVVILESQTTFIPVLAGGLTARAFQCVQTV